MISLNAWTFFVDPLMDKVNYKSQLETLFDSKKGSYLYLLSRKSLYSWNDGRDLYCNWLGGCIYLQYHDDTPAQSYQSFTIEVQSSVWSMAKPERTNLGMSFPRHRNWFIYEGEVGLSGPDESELNAVESGAGQPMETEGNRVSLWRRKSALWGSTVKRVGPYSVAQVFGSSWQFKLF